MFHRTCWIGALAFAALAPLAVDAQEEKKLGPADVAELSYVATTGNAEATTLGLRNLFTYTWADALFSFEVSALRADATTRTFVAILGPGGQPIVTESSDTEVTAEKYLGRLRYERSLATGPWYWFAGVGWEQNELAGIHSRTSAVGGIGRIWLESETAKWKTDLGATWTREEPVVFRRGVPRGFGQAEDSAGVRFTSGYLRKLGAAGNVTYTNDLVADANLDDTDDLRADMINAIAVGLSERLALKVSHQLLFDNQPGIRVVPIGSSNPPLGFVEIELDDVDTVLTVALVVNW